MAYELLSLNVPQISKAQPRGDAGGKKIAAALQSIGATIEKGRRRGILEKDIAAGREAQADLVAGEIDPMRVENEMAYAATITRNGVMNEVNQMMTDLDDPASSVSRMEPEDFRKHIRDKQKNFIEQNTGSKHADVNAAIFNKVLSANYVKVIGKHAINHKAKLKTGMSEQAVVALVTTPKVLGDKAYKQSTEELIKTALPNHVFTTAEQRHYLMTAAMQTATQGDRRLLDYVSENYDAKQLMPAEHAVAEKNLRRYKEQQEKGFWNSEYARYERMAREGTFTEAHWNSLIEDQAALDNLGGRSQIDSWLTGSGKARQYATTLETYARQFKAQYPMVGATPKQINEVVDLVMSEAISAGTPQVDAIQEMGKLLAAQNVISTDIKDSLNAALGRQVWTQAVATNEQFQAAFTMAAAFDEFMSNDQMVAQMGEAAYDTYAYMRDAMRYNGNNFEDAAASMAQATQHRKDHKLENRLSPEEHRQVTATLDDIKDGDLETSDPGLKAWLGMVNTAENALITGGIEADVRRQAELLILKGWNPQAAIEQGAKKVAARWKQFGGEMHFTGGAQVGEVFGFRPGRTQTELNDAWKFAADQFGKDSDNIVPILNGGVLTIVDKETGAELPPMPAETIGAMWEAKVLQEEEDRLKEEAADAIDAQQDTADMFNQMLYNWYGVTNGEAVFTTMPDGTSIRVADFERADLDTKTAYYEQWKRDYNQGTRRFAKALVTAGDWWANALSTPMDYFEDRAEIAEMLTLESPVGPAQVETFETGGEFGADEIPEEVPEAAAAVPITGAELLPVRGSEKVSAEFKSKVVDISKDLGIDPNDLMAVMAFESGGTFSPSVKNPRGTATGLIQFIESTAKGLGTTTKDLAKMSAEDQLDYVKKHFKPYKGRLKNVQDVYMAVLWPRAIGKGPNYVLWKKGTKAYADNKGLDKNKNGTVTAAEAASKVTDILGQAKQKGK